METDKNSQYESGGSNCGDCITCSQKTASSFAYLDFC